MALCRFLNFNLPKLLSAKSIVKNNDRHFLTGFNPVLTQERSFRRGYGRILRVMKLRRKIIGPERVRKRSEWDHWNYKSELYAFNCRLHENITEETLRCAFTHDAYIQAEEQKRKDLDIPQQDVQLDIKSNFELTKRGKEIASDFLKRYLRYCFQALPEEGIIALHNHLLSDTVLGYVSSNIGTKDLILCAEYPPEMSTMADSLLAIVGSIANDDCVSRAETFVLDFICMQLVGKDVFEIWELDNPSAVLNTILQKHGYEEYEPRIIFESGRNTIESIYNIGLYSGTTFLGRGPGETLGIAEEMAVYDCLRKLFQIRESEKPISSKQISSDALMDKVNSNPAVENWYSETLKSSICL